MSTETQLTVADLMTNNVVCVSETDNLVDAIATMEREGMSALPVTSKAGRVCGILSATDLIAMTYQLQADVAVFPFVTDTIRKSLTDAIAEDAQDSRVSEIMTSPVQTIRMSCTLVEAAKQLIENHVHHLPVINDFDKPIGIIATTDIVRAVAFHSENKN